MISKFCTSSVGKKYLMGFSALIWTGFVMAHMAGNLLIFVSPDAYNAYGHAITSGFIIYAVEVLLLGTLLLHVLMGIHLSIKNRMSKQTRYASAGSREKGANFGSKTMIFHGTIILFFIVTHLLTFKFGEVYLTTVNGVEMRDLHRLLVEVFSQTGYVVGYVIAMVLLGIHLRHGVGSMFQSFGFLHPSYQKSIKVFGNIYAFVVALGFISQPIYFYLFVK